MEQETNQSLNSVPGEAHVDSSEGELQNDGNTSTSANGAQTAGLTLEDIQAITGRKYDSLDKAKEGIKNTYSTVGRKVEGSTSELYGYTAQEIFSLKHPEAADMVDKIAAYAKGMKQTMEQAFNDVFKDVVAGRQTREQSHRETPVDSINVSSDNRITPEFKAPSAVDLDNMSVEQLKKVAIQAMQARK